MIPGFLTLPVMSALHFLAVSTRLFSYFRALWTKSVYMSAGTTKIDKELFNGPENTSALDRRWSALSIQL